MEATVPMLDAADEMRRLLAFLTKHKASDLHIKVGYPPFVRIGGHLRRLEIPPGPAPAFVHAMMEPLVPPERSNDFESRGSIDFSIAGDTGDRYRINMFRSMGEIHAAFRRVQSEIFDFDGLNLPEIYRTLISKT